METTATAGVYAERASRLGGGAVVWRVSVREPGGTGRVLPDGCMDLIWGKGGQGLLVAGPDTRAHVVERRGDAVGVRFPPGVGPAVFGVAAHELRDSLLPLEAVWPGREARLATERVAEAADRGAALEDVAADRLRAPRRSGRHPGPWLNVVVAGLARGRGVAELAGAVGLSERQLLRRSNEAFGYGPKTLARVLRMQRALGLAGSGEPLAAVAVGAGYADQAHLAREVRSLAGVPPTALGLGG